MHYYGKTIGTHGRYSPERENYLVVMSTDYQCITRREMGRKEGLLRSSDILLVTQLFLNG